MATHPEILAGPILRRVTENRVCVWIASSKPLHYQLQIKNQQLALLGSSDRGKFTEIKVGENLWVSLFEAWPDEGSQFPRDELLYYNFWHQSTNQELDLQSVCLKGQTSPGFFIPTHIKVLAHGSCRKPHGVALDENSKEIHTDSLSLLNEQLQKTQNDLNQRPALLCLTGDQIYADDVASPLINLLKVKATELMGAEIGVPKIADPGQIAEGQRGHRLRELKSGITSNHRENHLIGFGEYVAMYLYVFGNGSGWKMDLGRDDEDKRLNGFDQGLPNVRVALANIPTYMVFDDHEVTDDWNITRKWYDDIRFSPCGRRIVSNAIAAYWLFQGWGNNPEAHDREFIRSIQSHLAKPHDIVIAERFDLQMWKHQGWSYSIPTSPPILFLNTRTQRGFDKGEQPTRLMNRNALDQLRIAWSQLQTRDVEGAPVIISATPVFGFRAIEKFQELANLFGARASRYDNESWLANRDGFAALLDALLLKLNINEVVLLSGDVHLSFVNKASYFAKGKKINALQLTSSPLHNSPKEAKSIDKLAQLLDKTETYKGLNPGTDWPWYKRWLVPFISNDRKYPIWKARVSGLKAEANETLMTNRSNFALVYFEQGKAVKQRLVSGKNGDVYLDFNL